MKGACVSVVVPTWNGMDTLPELVARVREQETEREVELLAIDSGSTDGSREYLASASDVLVEIPAKSFNHGLTRNLGIERSRGELVVLLVQDALPADEQWLEALVRPLEENPRIVGTFSRQLPRPGASALTRHALSAWIAAQAAARTVVLDTPEAFFALSPLEQLSLCAFDDVCSCLRREVWKQHPFQEVAIAEDLVWAREVLLAGHALAFVPNSRVLHSHERGFGYELARTRLLHRELATRFGLRTIPSVRALALAVLSTLPAHLRALREEPSPNLRDVARTLSLAVAWPLGQYLGGRDAELGAPGRRVEGV